MENLPVWFAYGTLSFWILIALEFVVLTTFVNIQNGIGSTISVVAFAALLQIFGRVPILTFALENPLMLLLVVALYLVIGTAWGVFKWWLYSRDLLQDYRDFRREWLEKRNIEGDEIPLDKREAFQKDVLYKRNSTSHNQESDYEFGTIPKASKHKSLILQWMSFWFVSIFWTLCSDFILNSCNRIYRRIGGMLQTMSTKMWKDDLDRDKPVSVDEES